MNYEKDFLMKRNDLIYFDNAATTFKPISVINKEMEYLTNYTANSHRGDYNISFKVDDEVDNTRDLVKEYINSEYKEEIVFTSGTTDSLNMIVFGYFKYYLKEGDEVILNKAEHASNILPWMMLKKEIGIEIKYAPLDKNNKLTLESVKSVVNKKTKVISLALITNVVGDVRNISQISSFAHKNNILVVVDGAQALGHMNIDVQKEDIDFLAFSAHKMLGPTGLGILYGKKELLCKMKPVRYGGGMNVDFNEDELSLLPIPYKFEAGTQNLSAIIAFSESIKYINKVGMDSIERKERFLKKYLLNELKKLCYVRIYNENSESSIVLINVDGVSSGDLGLYLNSKSICVRSGKHCTKMLMDEADYTDTVRISLYFYNTYEEIDKLIEALSDIKAIKNF